MARNKGRGMEQTMAEAEGSEDSGQWYRVTLDTHIEITDRTAFSAAAFRPTINQETGEMSAWEWPEFAADMEIQGYLSEVLTQALVEAGERAGFRWRGGTIVLIGRPDETGNFPTPRLFPQPGPNGLPMHEAYPDVYPPPEAPQ